MFDLFNPPPENFTSENDFTKSFVSNDVNSIAGLRYIPNFLTVSEETSLINSINAEPWLSDIKRRVQHYGYKYDYKARTINYSMFLGSLPSWAKVFAERLFNDGYINVVPDQMIVNEYVPGQGIANHVDCEPCFSDTIISISLSSSCIMDFINLKTRQKIEVVLEPRSLVVISGEARCKWTHGIAQRKSDLINGIKTERKLRVSMTFRKVILK